MPHAALVYGKPPNCGECRTMFHECICLGLPSLAGYSLPEALVKARELGFQSVMSLPGGPNAKHSLGPFPTLGYDDPAGRGQLQGLLDGFARVSIHQAWDQDWQGWIDCAKLVGAQVVAVHAGICQGDPSEWLAATARHWRVVGDYAQAHGIRVGIENEGGARDTYLRLIREVDHPAVGATIDLGHCAYFVEVTAQPDLGRRVGLLNQTISDVLTELGDRVVAVHAHNVRVADWRDHRSVVSGAIDMAQAFRGLAQIGFRGSIDIELEEPDMEQACAETGACLDALCRSVLG